jgi:hypothetical protein
VEGLEPMRIEGDGIPSGAKAQPIPACYVRAEARTLHAKPVPFTQGRTLHASPYPSRKAVPFTQDRILHAKPRQVLRVRACFPTGLIGVYEAGPGDRLCWRRGACGWLGRGCGPALIHFSLEICERDLLAGCRGRAYRREPHSSGIHRQWANFGQAGGRQ